MNKNSETIKKETEEVILGHYLLGEAVIHGHYDVLLEMLGVDIKNAILNRLTDEFDFKITVSMVPKGG